MAEKPDISLLVAQRRKDLHLSRPEVSARAREAGTRLSSGYLKAVEDGRVPSAKILNALAHVYGDDPANYLKLAGYLPGPLEPRAPIDWDALLDADKRLSEEWRNALRVIIHNALNRPT